MISRFLRETIEIRIIVSLSRHKENLKLTDLNREKQGKYEETEAI